MITTITGENQITIPAELVRQLNLQPGTRLDWSIQDDGTLIARRIPRRGELARKVAGMGRAWLTQEADPIAELITERMQDDVGESECDALFH